MVRSNKWYAAVISLGTGSLSCAINGLQSKIPKFADNTKLVNKALTEIDWLQLEADMNKMMDWAHVCQMNFNITIKFYTVVVKTRRQVTVWILMS